MHKKLILASTILTAIVLLTLSICYLKGRRVGLLYYAHADKWDEVLRLIKSGADINLMDNYGNTVLMVASYFASEEVINDLLRYGADLDMRDNYGRTAILIAAQKSRFEIVHKFLDAGADIHVKDKRGQNLLSLAALNGDLFLARTLLGNGFNPDIKLESGWTPLCICLQSNNYSDIASRIQMVQLLMDYGADIDYDNPDGYSYIMSHDSYIGTGRTSPEFYGSNALEIAQNRHFAQIVEMLIKRGETGDSGAVEKVD
ncbi:MAG: hypothetical protein GXY41_07210 [Phycisphaerae bacterium]|mgnify:CR=1 FL=1|nr:hypothetical protein [Phycisphaerae bacterium]